MQPSQIARGIGSLLDWATLFIPGGTIEKSLVKAVQAPGTAKKLGKLVGVAEKAAKLVKEGDSVKDVAFAIKNIRDHTRTSRRRENIAGAAVAKVGKGMDTGLGVMREAKKNQGSTSILNLLTFEHWAGKLGSLFDRPPQMLVDREYEDAYLAEKRRLEAEIRQVKQKAYQTKLKMGLFKQQEEQLQAKEESLRVDEQVLSRELAKQEAKLRAQAKQQALKKWRLDCASWYRDEMERHLQKIMDQYTQTLPARFEMYQTQRLQALQDALEKEQNNFDELNNTSVDEASVVLEQVTALIGEINHVFGG